MYVCVCVCQCVHVGRGQGQESHTLARLLISFTVVFLLPCFYSFLSHSVSNLRPFLFLFLHRPPRNTWSSKLFVSDSSYNCLFVFWKGIAIEDKLQETFAQLGNFLQLINTEMYSINVSKVMLLPFIYFPTSTTTTTTNTITTTSPSTPPHHPQHFTPNNNNIHHHHHPTTVAPCASPSIFPFPPRPTAPPTTPTWLDYRGHVCVCVCKEGHDIFMWDRRWFCNSFTLNTNGMNGDTKYST